MTKMSRTKSHHEHLTIVALLLQHLSTAGQALRRLWQQKGSAALTICVLGVTLALPAYLQVLITNVNGARFSWEGTLQTSLFLKPEITEAQGLALVERLNKNPQYTHVEFISKTQALEEFRAQSPLQEALEALDENPLPHVVVVRPPEKMSSQAADALLRTLRALPEVEQVKFDTEWLNRLFAVLNILNRAILVIAALLGFAVIVSVANTLRLEVFARQAEIQIMKLIGASDAFVRRPFLYAGLWYG